MELNFEYPSNIFIMLKNEQNKQGQKSQILTLLFNEDFKHRINTE